MRLWKAIVPLLLILCALSSGCLSTSSSGGYPKDLAKQSIQTPFSFKKGKLIVDNSLSPDRNKRFDDGMIKGIQNGWDALPLSGTKNTVDCTFSYENKTHDVSTSLTFWFYVLTFGNIPWRASSDITCSAQITIYDETGKTIKTLQAEKVLGEETCYMSLLLPTSWLVRLCSRAPIRQAGFYADEIDDVSEQLGTMLFRAVVIKELNRVAGELPQ